MFGVEDPGTIGAAAAVLAPLSPGRSGTELRFQVRREGGGPDKVRNLVGRLDRKRIWGTLSLVGSQAEPDVAPVGTAPEDAMGLVESWDAALADAAARVARSPVRARARLDGLPPAGGAARRSPEPDPQPGGDRASLPRQLGPGLRHLAGHGAALPRTDRGRRDHGSCPRARTCCPRPGTKQRSAPSGASPDAPSKRTIFADPRMPWDACGSHRKRSVPARPSATFQVCVPTKRSGVVFRL